MGSVRQCDSELTRCNLVVAVTHSSELLVDEVDLCLFKLLLEESKVLLTHVLVVGLVLILLVVDVVTDIIDLALSLVDGSV